MPKVLLVRSAPFDANSQGYNVQEMGLAKALCDKGFDVDWYALKSKNQTTFIFYEKDDHVAKCVEIPRKRVFRWGINLNLCKKSFLAQYDLVICFEYMQLMTFLIARHIKNGILYSGPYYNLFTFKIFSPIFDFFATNQINRSFPKIFTKSILAKNFLERKGYSNVSSVGVGLDVERFQRKEVLKPETQALISYMESNRCLLYVGALSKRKNYSFLLKVYNRVLEKYPDIKFVVVGRGVPTLFMKLLGKGGSSYVECCERKYSKEVLNGIKHIEQIDNEQLKYIYPLAKAFLLPSKQEIFGMVLLESMYLGAPVIASENGGSKTVIENQDSGQIVKEFNDKKWADAVYKYIENPAYTKLVVENAKRIVETDYSWTTIASKFLK